MRQWRWICDTLQTAIWDLHRDLEQGPKSEMSYVRLLAYRHRKSTEKVS